MGTQNRASAASKTVTVVKDTFSLSHRLPFLLVGLLFFSFGVFMLAKAVLAAVDIAMGRPFEGHFLFGAAIAIAFTLTGAAGIWVFFIAKEVLEFDEATGKVVSTRYYPFGSARQKSFDLNAMAVPEVVWLEETDRTDGGYWALKVALPDGRKVTFPSDANLRSEEKADLESLRRNIAEMMG